MQQQVLESAMDGAGYTTIAGTIIMTGLEWFSGVTINETLHVFASIGGIVFVWYKVKSISIDIKLKKQQHKKNEDEKKI